MLSHILLSALMCAPLDKETVYPDQLPNCISMKRPNEMINKIGGMPLISPNVLDISINHS